MIFQDGGKKQQKNVEISILFSLFLNISEY